MCEPMASAPTPRTVRVRVRARLGDADLVEGAVHFAEPDWIAGSATFFDLNDIAERQFPGRSSRVAEPSRSRWLLRSCGVLAIARNFWFGWNRYVTTDGCSAPPQVSSQAHQGSARGKARHLFSGAMSETFVLVDQPAENLMTS